jgi:hypothetical protein
LQFQTNPDSKAFSSFFSINFHFVFYLKKGGILDILTQKKRRAKLKGLKHGIQTLQKFKLSRYDYGSASEFFLIYFCLTLSFNIAPI